MPGIKEGSFTSLNTDQFMYYSFFSRINVQLRSRWVQQLRNYAANLNIQRLNEIAAAPRTTQIEILIDPDGAFIESILIRTAGYRVLDQAVLNSFKSAAPFLNPPRELVESDGYIHLKYSFRLQWRSRFIAR